MIGLALKISENNNKKMNKKLIDIDNNKLKSNEHMWMPPNYALNTKKSSPLEN